MLTFRFADGPGFRLARTVPVVVAQTDMPEGATIDRMSLVVARWPVGTVPAGAFTSIDSVASRVTRVRVFKGEALVPGRLAPQGARPGLEVKITPGKRAMSFRVSDASALAGLIQPNSRVDVLLVGNRGESRPFAKLVMENLRVLAIGTVPQRSTDGRAINASVATVEVTPDEAEVLAIATSQGAIQLILRGYPNPDPNLTFGSTHRLDALPKPQIPKRERAQGPITSHAVILRP
jgi:pilus assembly protein CpaB